MANESVIRTPKGVSIEFNDEFHDALATVCQGLIKSVHKITIGNEPASFSNGVLNVHIDGDPANIAVREMEFNTTKVTAIAFSDLSTGIQRIGHPSGSNGGGTVVVLLLHLKVPDSTLARAAITATEAITAAVQDLGLSCDSMPASGSQRQDIIVIRDCGSGLFLRGAGKHCKLGELIGRSTIESVKESAARNGTDIGSRKSALSMLAMYGYDTVRLSEMSGKNLSITERDSDPKIIATVSAVIHLYNESRWGLVSEEVASSVGRAVIASGIGEPVEGADLLETLALTVIRHVFNRR